MAASQTFTGKAGNVTIGTTVIPITKWSAKIMQEYADATDSSTFDPTTGQTWKTQDPGPLGIEGAIEGYFDQATTDATIVQGFLAGGPFAVTLGYTTALTFMTSTPCDFTDFEVTVQVPGANMVGFTLNYKSHGIPTLT